MTTLKNRFEKYHADNPHVYEAFRKFALESAARRPHFSARAIFHRMRWQTMITGNDEFKINNNYSAFYARMFENDYPDLKGFFETRKQQNEFD